MILSLLRSAVPSLRNRDISRFSLHKPLAAISPRQLVNLTEAQVDLEYCMEATRTFETFPVAQSGNSEPTDVIIHIHDECEGTYFVP
jgi:hypothetical protein